LAQVATRRAIAPARAHDALWLAHMVVTTEQVSRLTRVPRATGVSAETDGLEWASITALSRDFRCRAVLVGGRTH